MTTVVDFHTHVFSNPFGQWISKLPAGQWLESKSGPSISQIRKKARGWIKPVVGSAHRLQSMFRHMPEIAHRGLDEMGAVVPLPGLLIESTASDLKEAMREADVNYAVIIAHPKVIPNEFILELCENNPEFIAAVNIPKNTVKPGLLLKRYAKQGAKLLKIHAASDGEGVQSPRYKSLLKAASELGMPVILHTGCLHMSLVYKDPTQGKAEQFTQWYEKYPETQFILAHMNFHDPNTALDLCEEYRNLYVDTSWQPAEVIGEAVRRIGADRVLFGTDWPLIGNNILVGRRRIEDAIHAGWLNEDQSKLILGGNAVKLLGIGTDAT
jgi:uncharacterized protein